MKLKSILILTMLLFSVGPALAQTSTPIVSPTMVEFTSPDHTTVIGDQPVIVSYVLEIWSPGTDTTTAAPQLQSQPIPKALALPVAATNPIKYRIKLSDSGLNIPLGPTWVLTIKSVGPTNLTARSPISNSFTFPLTMRAPLPTGAPVMEK